MNSSVSLMDGYKVILPNIINQSHATICTFAVSRYSLIDQPEQRDNGRMNYSQDTPYAHIIVDLDEEDKRECFFSESAWLPHISTMPIDKIDLHAGS